MLDAVNRALSRLGFEFPYDVDEWIEDNGYLVFDDYVVINLGL